MKKLDSSSAHQVAPGILMNYQIYTWEEKPVSLGGGSHSSGKRGCIRGKRGLYPWEGAVVELPPPGFNMVCICVCARACVCVCSAGVTFPVTIEGLARLPPHASYLWVASAM